MEIDIKESPFEEKILAYIENISEDIKATKKEVAFHQLIVDTFEKDKIEHEYIQVLKDSIKETNKLIETLENKQKKAQTLKQFIAGNLIMDMDSFCMLMIDILAQQTVNYVELKQEFEKVSKKWKKN